MTALIVKAIAQFQVNFARIVPMEAAEGEAVIGKQVSIGDIEVFSEAEKRAPKFLPTEGSKVACWGR